MVQLTIREREVIHYLSKGYSNDEIANKLHISVHTVKAHLESIYEKIEVKNRVQAAIKAAKLGIINVSEII